jgi:transcriptional regulator with XRE-family HTH domain
MLTMNIYATGGLLERIRDRRELPPPADCRALRLAADLTLEDIAEVIGDVTPTAVGHWERGVRRPSRRHLSAYLNVLRVLRQELDSAA